MMGYYWSDAADQSINDFTGRARYVHSRLVADKFFAEHRKEKTKATYDHIRQVITKPDFQYLFHDVSILVL